MDLAEEYKRTLEQYNQMVVQMKLNRGGNPTVLRLLKAKLEQLEKANQVRLHPRDDEHSNLSNSVPADHTGNK